MKQKNQFPFVLVLLCAVSLVSACYLHWNAILPGWAPSPLPSADPMVTEESVLPELQFIKELLKSIFNVVKVSVVSF